MTHKPWRDNWPLYVRQSSRIFSNTSISRTVDQRDCLANNNSTFALSSFFRDPVFLQFVEKCPVFEIEPGGSLAAVPPSCIKSLKQQSGFRLTGLLRQTID